ncbi:hypothetical protein IQ06DRAFT_349468 [Phaeosphaeriaceae sp. SRC1lsM3a]|nr:hypothetical protein IQ06DRAFT_349468 [Stagonospora sp. SRC1lsM3a]
MPTTPNPQHGLLWNPTIWGTLEPTWTIEPNIDIILKIAQRELNIPNNAQCDIRFLASGAFNKAYTISVGTAIRAAMRISLPVDPHFKTMSEAATIAYVRHHTSIPAPAVLACDASNANELGFEWMIEEYVPGRSLEEAWRGMSWLNNVEKKGFSPSLQELARRHQRRLDNLGMMDDESE